MKLTNIKKNNEYVWASIFVKYLNSAFQTNYKLVPEMEESSPIDMHVVADDGKSPHLDLQLTHAIEVPFVALEAHTDVDYSKQPTIDAIERKLAKLTKQKADLGQIVLIIQGYMNRKSAIKVFADPEFKKFADYPFEAIYYVSPTMIAEETNEAVQDGVVVPIKPIRFK